MPCLSHSLKISPGAGIRSSIDDTMLRCEPRRGPLAVFGKAAFVLRPQPVHHEGVGPSATLDLLVPPGIAALGSLPRRTTGTRTATARKNQTRRVHSAGVVLRRTAADPAQRDETRSQDQRKLQSARENECNRT